jgi:transposase
MRLVHRIILAHLSGALSIVIDPWRKDARRRKNSERLAAYAGRTKRRSSGDDRSHRSTKAAEE